MADSISALSRAVSDILTGEYARKRVTQETLAERAGMSVWTLQKKLRGRSPVTATDLVVIAQAIGVDPADVLSRAITESGMAETADTPVSEAPVSLDDHRNRRKPSEMTEDEMEGVRNAAGTDPELEQDEPEQP